MVVTGNLWAIFSSVTQQEPMQLATIVDRQGEVYTVQMQGGNNVSVQSSAAYELQSKVFIRGGAIVKQAPDLPYVEIEV